MKVKVIMPFVDKDSMNLMSVGKELEYEDIRAEELISLGRVEPVTGKATEEEKPVEKKPKAKAKK